MPRFRELPWFSLTAEACRPHALIYDYCTEHAVVCAYRRSVPCKYRGFLLLYRGLRLLRKRAVQMPWSRVTVPWSAVSELYAEDSPANFQHFRGKSSCEHTERYFFNGLQIRLHKNWPEVSIYTFSNNWIKSYREENEGEISVRTYQIHKLYESQQKSWAPHTKRKKMQ